MKRVARRQPNVAAIQNILPHQAVDASRQAVHASRQAVHAARQAVHASHQVADASRQTVLILASGGKELFIKILLYPVSIGRLRCVTSNNLCVRPDAERSSY